MSIRAHVRKLRPIQENKIDYVNKIKKFVTESSLSKPELQNLLVKGQTLALQELRYSQIK